MRERLSTQYDGFHREFSRGTKDHNEASRGIYYKALEGICMSGEKVLDVGCGDGFDMRNYTKLGAHCYGIDSSKELARSARINVPESQIEIANMEDLPYKDSSFDVVLSKWAIQTSRDVPRVIREMDRVLKPGGTMVYLAVHPLRQFLEKEKHPKDYFLQEEVSSTFFEGGLTVREPTHTMNEYLSPEFLRKYRIVHFGEHTDFPSVKKVDEDSYPCFFIVKAIKDNS